MTDSTGRRFALSASGNLAMAISGILASAQVAVAQGAIEEIIVTATKREVSLQDLAQAVTAFTSDDIEQRGFEGLDDYANQIPSLSFGRREPGGTSVVFRGVAASGLQFGTNPSSGVYLDEQPITAAGLNPDPRLIDIERIEALSGPQGTLFGDASQSGTLRIITNKPDPDAFEGWVDLSLSGVDGGDTGYDVSAMVNIPLSDAMALRLVGFTSEEAGYVDNVLQASPGGTFDNSANVAEDINTSEYTGGRAALRWDASENWTVDLQAVFQKLDVDGFGDVNTDVGDLQQVRFREETLNEDWSQFAFTVEGETRIGDFVVTAAVFNRDFRYDADATDYQFAFNAAGDYVDSFYPYYDLTFYDFGGDPHGFAFNDIEIQRQTIEARLASPSDSDSRWSGIAGVFYNRSDSEALFSSGNDQFFGSPGFYYLSYNPYNTSLNGLPPGSWGFSNNWYFGAYDTEIRQTAVFGEVTFEVTENFSITAGGRWYDVDRRFGLLQGGLSQKTIPNRNTDFITLDNVQDSSETGFVPKINFSYQPSDDRLFYATYAEGFRSGGANVVRPGSIIPRSYESDLLKSFEIGAKTTWADGSFRLNLAAYRMTWEDIQIQANDPQPTIFVLGIINFPEAEIIGGEADLLWVPADGWELSSTFSYNEAEISGTTTLFGDTPNPLTATDGTRLPLTPDFKANVGVQYTFPNQWLGEPFVRVDYSYVGESVNSLAGVEAVVFAPPPTVQKEYDNVDLRFGLDGEKWSASLAIDNLTDERAQQFFSNRWAKQRLSVNRPRTYVFNIRRRF